MPTYTFKHKTTNEEKDMILSMNERELFLKDNQDWEQIITKAPAIGDPWRYGSNNKVPGSFNDLLKKIKKGNKGSNINTGNISQI